MQTLWAPWRMEYINQEKPQECIFCTFPTLENDRDNLLLGRSAHSFAMLNRFPYNNGHLMVIPRRHVAQLSALSAEEYADLQALLREAVAILGEEYKPEGMNVGMNLGRVAGAGIDQHLHWHAVPRWGGDTNFMPVIGETKVMVDHLLGSFERLRPRFDALV